MDSEIEDILKIIKRLESWNINCRNLMVDLRTVVYESNSEDTFITFEDKSYYENRLYFKIDSQNPKDPKITHATKQLCKIIGLPYNFFCACRPSLKMNIMRTWQAGLSDDDKKSQTIFKIRESRDCSLVRAITPIKKSIIPLHEILNIIRRTLDTPFYIESVSGDKQDDLVFNARFILDKEYDFNGPIFLGFSLTSSELDASSLILDVLIYNKLAKTSCISLYNGESFFESDFTNLQPSEIKEIIPLMLNRLEEEVPEIISKMEDRQKNVDSNFAPDLEALDICRYKGLSSKIRKAIYHEVSECLEEIRTPWDLATHVGLVAKDFESSKRIKIERAAGSYMNLHFSKG